MTAARALAWADSHGQLRGCLIEVMHRRPWYLRIRPRGQMGGHRG